jgi:hypothetical protein
LRILRALRKGPVAGALPQRKRPRLNGCGEGPAISGSPTWRYAATAGSKDASPPCRSPAPQGRAGKSPPDPSRPFAMTSAHQACRVRRPSAGQPVRFSLGVTPRSPAGDGACPQNISREDAKRAKMASMAAKPLSIPAFRLLHRWEDEQRLRRGASFSLRLRGFARTLLPLRPRASTRLHERTETVRRLTCTGQRQGHAACEHQRGAEHFGGARGLGGEGDHAGHAPILRRTALPKR